MRRLTLVAVTAAHVLALVWIAKAARTRVSAAPNEPPPLIAFSWIVPEDEAEPESQVPTPRLRKVFPQPRAEEEQPPPDASRVDSPSTAITDWAEDARAVADEYMRREQAKDSLRSFAHKFPEPSPPEKPGVFGSEKRNRRKGLIEPGYGNTERRWVTDNCYFEFDRGAPPPPPIAGGFRTTKSLRCKPPPTGGGEHMFDHLKPEYLKRPPVPDQ